MNPSEISHATARVPQEVYQAALDRALKAEEKLRAVRKVISHILTDCHVIYKTSSDIDSATTEDLVAALE